MLGGDAEHAADDLKRQRARELAGEVHPAACDDRVDERVRGRLDRLAVAVDRARCEATAEGAAHSPVALAVEGDQPAGEHPEQLELGRADERGQEVGAVEDLAGARVTATDLGRAAQDTLWVDAPRRREEALDERLVARRACVGLRHAPHCVQAPAPSASAFFITTAIVLRSSVVGLNSIVSVPGSAAGVCPGRA